MTLAFLFVTEKTTTDLENACPRHPGPLCVRISETVPPSEITVEGERG